MNEADRYDQGSVEKDGLMAELKLLDERISALEGRFYALKEQLGPIMEIEAQTDKAGAPIATRADPLALGIVYKSRRRVEDLVTLVNHMMNMIRL